MKPDPPNVFNLDKPADRQTFNQLVYLIVRQIPTGRVMTYGQIASFIPTPSNLDPLAYQRIRARWVGYALADCPADVPWHRVLNKQGRASHRHGGSHNIQLAMLDQEGTPRLKGDRVDLSRARWDPAGGKTEPNPTPPGQTQPEPAEPSS
jgi:methylated-DNA-protein-cysteine methyltransferase-like protein